MSYVGSMQVLTMRGWLNWDECGKYEDFLVPDVETKKLSVERLKIIKRFYEGELFCFENKKMCYKVTPDCRMYFNNDYSSKKAFEIVDARNMSDRGSFQIINGYKLFDPNSECDPFFQFIGFALGDGSGKSSTTIKFTLKKERKIDYLLNVLSKLEWKYYSSQYKKRGDWTFLVRFPNRLNEWIDLKKRFENKHFDLTLIKNMKFAELKGVFDGLVNSDGSKSSQHDYISFCNSSKNLCEVFSILSQLQGFECHYVTPNQWDRRPRRTWYVISLMSKKSTVCSRKQYHFKEHYSGDVYNTDKLTGFLILRGRITSFGFISGC